MELEKPARTKTLHDVPAKRTKSQISFWLKQQKGEKSERQSESKQKQRFLCALVGIEQVSTVLDENFKSLLKLLIIIQN